MKRLVLWDGSTTGWLESAASGEWHVAVVGASDVMLREQHALALAKLVDVRFLDLAPHAAQAREQVASYLTDALAVLPREDLGDLWWALEITEKSPFRGPLVERLYRLALLEGLRSKEEYEEVILAVDDPLLAQVLDAERAASASLDSRRYWMNAFREVRSALLARLVAFLGRWPRQGGRATCFTFYPYWWLRPFDDSASERFLDVRPPLFSYAAWLSEPRHLLHRRGAARVAGQRVLTPLQREIGLGALLRVLSPWTYLRVLRAARRARPVPPFGEVDVTPLIASDLVRSLSSTQLFAFQLIRDAVGRYVRRAEPVALLYRVEFQPFEHALLLGAGGIPTVGFRHSPFGSAYIPMRFGPGSLGQTDMPLPDAMLVSGPVGAAALAAQGYPGPVAVCGPQRHPDLAAAVRRVKLRTRRPEELVAYVAIAIVRADTEALLAAVAYAARQLPELRLVLKTHPSRQLPVAELRAILTAVGLTERVSFAGPDLYEDITASDAVVLVGSTLAFEAIALGVPAIVFENPATYAATSLAEYKTGLHIVRNGAELARALSDVHRDSQSTRAKRDRWPELLRSVFGDLDAPIDSLLTDSLRAVGVEGQAR